MKKLNKVGKTIALSTVAAIAFGSVALTTTYALFTSEANTNVTVSSGKVKVSTDVILTGAKTLNDGVETNVEATNDKTVTFGAGGTATVSDDGNVKLSNIVAGDYVTVQVTAKSQSNVNIKYRMVVTNSGDAEFNKIVTLEGKAGDNDMKKSENGLFTKYQTASATDSEKELGVYSFTFGIDKDTVVNDGEARSGEISIKLEAIQGNAKTEDISEYFEAKTSSDLVSTIASADANSTIEIASEIALEDTLNVNKDLNLVLANDVTAPSEKFAFNVTDNATLTIGTKSTSSSSSTKCAIKKAVDGPVIQATKNAVVADGGNVVVNSGSIISTEGSGIVAKNGGNVTVEDGYVQAHEAGLLAYLNGSITVNGGTFETVDNFVVGTNGTTDWGNNTITINGGTFNGNVESTGCIACGVYVANSDIVTINGGTFNIENGCGVLARSGNTTVSDDVVFNFTNTQGGATSGQVGDKVSQVPVNAKVVQDLSLPSYPGGKPVVNANGVVAIHQTTGKTYLVSTEEELKAAIANEDNLTTKYIFVKNDIDLKTITYVNNDARIALDIKSKNTYIYGDGATISNKNSTDPRVINVYGDENDFEGGSLSVSGINLSEWDLNGAWASRKCINLYQTTNFTLTIDGCNIESEHYAIYQYDTAGSKISVKNSYVKGYGCLYNVTGTNTKDGVTAVFENTTLFGNNYYDKRNDNNFANIKFEGSPSNVVNNLTFNKCNFVMYSKYGNSQLIASIASSNDDINMTNCSFVFKNDAAKTPITGLNLKNYLNSPSWFVIDGVKY